MIVCPTCGAPAVPKRERGDRGERAGRLIQSGRGPGTYVWECSVHDEIAVGADEEG